MADAETANHRGLRGLPRWQRATLLVLAAGLVAALLLVVTVGAAFAYVQRTATVPPPDELETPDPTVIRDRDGERLQTFEPAELRRNTSLEDLPEHVPAAVLAAEDRRFYEHGGYSIHGILRAARANLTAGQVEQGASTIHQQYVAMAVADIGDGYLDKFREVAIASRLDDEVAKDEVLEMYLNEVPFGRTARGIEAAARTYFDVPATELDVEQAAVLAGIIAAPTAFDPERNPEGAAARRDFTIEGMVETGTLGRSDADEIVGSDLPALREDPIRTFGPDEYFLDVVREQVPDLVEDERLDVAEGLDVHTTLDPRAQELAIEELNEHLGELEPSGAISTLDSDTGAVRALVGGLDFESEQVNAAMVGHQVGSAYKTFGLVELVERGYSPDATRVDAPEEYEVEQEGSEDHTVGNYTGRGHGEVSVREATADSVNTAYVRLAEELGPDNIANIAQQMGIQQELETYPVSILGTDTVRPLELASAYATLSAEGQHHQPYLVERIESHDGEVLYEHEPDPREVLDPNTAHVVTDVLTEVVTSGTGTAASTPHPVAGKTGTTDEYRAAWFVGYTPETTTAVWVGNRDNTVMDAIAGGGIPSQVFGGYMTALLEDEEPGSFPTPDTSSLRELTGLEAPEPEEDDEDGFLDLGEDARDPEDDDEDDEDDDEGDDDEDEDDEDEDDEDEDDEDPEDDAPGQDEDGGPGNGEGNGNGDDEDGDEVSDADGDDTDDDDGDSEDD